MDAQLSRLIGWAAPIVASILICFGQAMVNLGQRKISDRMDKDKEATDAKRKAEAEWREDIDKRMNCQDTKIESVLEAQCTQMRSDITHKIHRYMDDLKCASTEEKDSLWAEYEVYCDICAKHGIKNHFVEQLVKQVMDLPDREHQKKE